jgi:hypothetical protein
MSNKGRTELIEDSKMSMAESGGHFSEPSATLAEQARQIFEHVDIAKDDTIIETATRRRSTPNISTARPILDHALTSNSLAAPRSPRGPQPHLRVRAHRLQHLLGQLAHQQNVANVARQTRRIAYKEPGRFPTNKRNEGPKFRQEAVRRLQGTSNWQQICWEHKTQPAKKKGNILIQLLAECAQKGW